MLKETVATRPGLGADPMVRQWTKKSSSPRFTGSRNLARLAGTFGGGAILGIALLMAVWSVLYAARLFPDNLFPSVPAVWRAGVQMWQEGVLSPDITASIREAAVGFVIGTVLGIALALATATTRAGRFILQPVLRLLAPIPTIGLIPLAILWFGIGDTSKYVVVALGVFVPVWINAHAGLASTPSDYLQVSGCLGSSRWLTLRRVILPEALPDIVAGMRVGCATAFVVIVVAEMTGTTNGLGYRISQAQLFSQADRLIFLLAVLGVVGAICDQLIVNVARPFTAWASEEN
ncbi:ABC transporter permease [Lacisediminihabitans sp.]|jgi:NitT/TauT family transport system permease protein/sulfonate transport system permease protein|uniref:ABC transporter permease n=1 Tax=Lacisediminihabitans sp. TaxID=2787631 RepID=UPI002F95A331